MSCCVAPQGDSCTEYEPHTARRCADRPLPLSVSLTHTLCGLLPLIMRRIFILTW